jgi:serine/threonine protein kinase
MDRNADAAAAVDHDEAAPSTAADSHVRALRPARPESEARADGLAPTLDDTAGADTAGASERPAALLSPGTCVAEKYVICDVLGTGGSAVVYAAEQINLRRVVAFKLHPARGALASLLLSRFEREAELLARVHHENVVAVFDAGRMPDGSPYLVVQRLQGDSLATRLREAGPLPVTEAVDFTRQVLDALIALSDAGIIHRDVKPDNIVLDRLPDDRTVLKLVDFGIAKEAHDEASRALDQMVGTPGYMPPEQVHGEGIDARSDLYALGATLYEMLTGCTPHSGETVEEVSMATLFGSIAPPGKLRADCPEGLAQIAMRALAKDPSERFASAREMKSALERWQEDESPGASLALARAQDDSDDTLRLRIRARSRPRPRGRLGQRGLAALACVAAFAFFATQGALPVESTAQLSGGVTALAGDLAPLDLALQARDHANALAAGTSTFATELVTEVRSSDLLARTNTAAAELLTRTRNFAYDLLEVYRQAAPAWSGMLGRSARE